MNNRQYVLGDRFLQIGSKPQIDPTDYCKYFWDCYKKEPTRKCKGREIRRKPAVFFNDCRYAKHKKAGECLNYQEFEVNGGH